MDGFDSNWPCFGGRYNGFDTVRSRFRVLNMSALPKAGRGKRDILFQFFFDLFLI
jgi:hypothetical protein